MRRLVYDGAYKKLKVKYRNELKGLLTKCRSLLPDNYYLNIIDYITHEDIPHLKILEITLRKIRERKENILNLEFYLNYNNFILSYIVINYSLIFNIDRDRVVVTYLSNAK